MCVCVFKKDIVFRDLSWRKIESVFGHFTKFIIRKTDSLLNSMSENRTLHKIRHSDMKVSNILHKKLHLKISASEKVYILTIVSFAKNQ